MTPAAPNLRSKIRADLLDRWQIQSGNPLINALVSDTADQVADMIARHIEGLGSTAQQLGIKIDNTRIMPYTTP